MVEPRRGAVPVDADTSSASKLTTSATTGVSSLEPAGGGDDTTVTSGDQAGTPPDSSPKDNGGERAPLGGGCGGGDNGGSSDFRAVESKVHEVLESLTFHLSVLQRSVDQAHINMRIASQEFSSLLKKVGDSYLYNLIDGQLGLSLYSRHKIFPAFTKKPSWNTRSGHVRVRH